MKSQKLPLRKYIFLFLTYIASGMSALCQTLGGNAAYNFLKLPGTPQLSALGGVNISNMSNDAGMAFNNPSLLRAGMHQQLHLSFNSMYAGVKNYHSYFAYRNDKWKTNFGAGIYYLDYGSLTQTDAAGNIMGAFHPTDYVVQVSASRQYGNKWHYGAAFKFIGSNYGLYLDTSRLFQVSLLLKNMGTQTKQYQDSRPDDLPFDAQLGFTKKLARAPIQFSVTAHHLHQFNIRYSDSTFNNNNSLEPTNGENSFTLDKIFRHIVLAAQVYAGRNIEITAAYNYLLRKELVIANATNGFTGFSLGIGVLFRKIQIRYARSHYQNNTAYNQLGLNLALNEF
jgi:hypothetical protein